MHATAVRRVKVFLNIVFIVKVTSISQLVRHSVRNRRSRERGSLLCRNTGPVPRNRLHALCRQTGSDDIRIPAHFGRSRTSPVVAYGQCGSRQSPCPQRTGSPNACTSLLLHQPELGQSGNDSCCPTCCSARNCSRP